MKLLMESVRNMSNQRESIDKEKHVSSRFYGCCPDKDCNYLYWNEVKCSECGTNCKKCPQIETEQRCPRCFKPMEVRKRYDGTFWNYFLYCSKCRKEVNE